MKRLLISFLLNAIFASSMHAMEVSEDLEVLHRPLPLNQLLAYAAEERQLERCKELIAAGADPFYKGSDKYTVLMSAARMNALEVCELLVEKMLSIPSAEQKKRIYIFMHWIKSTYPRTVYNQFKSVFKEPLRAMIKKENTPKVIRQICSVHDREDNLFKKYFPKEFQFLEALYANDLEKAQALIIAGVHPDDIMGSEGKTVLMAAAEKGSKDVVKLLINAGAQVDHKDDKGWTALCYATKNIHSKACRKICSMLINAGADAAIAGWDDVGE